MNHVEALIRPNRLAEITPASLSRFQAELRAKGLKETSIATHLKHLRAALGWAKSIGLIATVPVFNLPKRVRGAKMMRGRPVTPEEFDRMLETIQSIVGAKAAASWRHYLQGLWWSGLRLGESLEVYWDRDDRLCVDLSGKFPMLRIPAEFEKGNQDRLLPMAPEFAKFLFATPGHDRIGLVFKLIGLRGQPSKRDEDWVSRVVARIGKAAAVKVNTDPTNGKIKYASAHDLRRSFGERWAHRIMPQLLKELMRHESIETTMRYYVGSNSQLTAEALWRCMSLEAAADSGDDTQGLKLLG